MIGKPLYRALPKTLYGQVLAGFLLSIVVVGVAVASPKLAQFAVDGNSPAPGESSDPVGAISQVFALDPVQLQAPMALASPQQVAPADAPSSAPIPQAVPTRPATVLQVPPAGPSPTPGAGAAPVQTTEPREVPGACSAQNGPLNVAPDPVNLPTGTYTGTFTIHHCTGPGSNWTITRPPSIATSADSGTLEGGARQPINFTVDPAKLDSGPFHLRVRVSTAGQNIYVDIHGSKPAPSVSGATGAGTGSGGITPGDSSP